MIETTSKFWRECDTTEDPKKEVRSPSAPPASPNWALPTVHEEGMKDYYAARGRIPPESGEPVRLSRALGGLLRGVIDILTSPGSPDRPRGVKF